MNKLIKYFNKKYGKKYGKISYPRTTIQIYQVYQIIKDCNIEDNELTKLLHNVKLPKPKTMEEMEMYSECINDGIPQNKMMPQILNEYTIELTADELNNLEYHESMAGDYRVLDFSKYNSLFLIIGRLDTVFKYKSAFCNSSLDGSLIVIRFFLTKPLDEFIIFIH